MDKLSIETWFFRVSTKGSRAWICRLSLVAIRLKLVMHNDALTRVTITGLHYFSGQNMFKKLLRGTLKRVVNQGVNTRLLDDLV